LVHNPSTGIGRWRFSGLIDRDGCTHAPFRPETSRRNRPGTARFLRSAVGTVSSARPLTPRLRSSDLAVTRLVERWPVGSGRIGPSSTGASVITEVDNASAPSTGWRKPRVRRRSFLNWLKGRRWRIGSSRGRSRLMRHSPLPSRSRMSGQSYPSAGPPCSGTSHPKVSVSTRYQSGVVNPPGPGTSVSPPSGLVLAGVECFFVGGKTAPGCSGVGSSR
jgi:hypothetical protein